MKYKKGFKYQLYEDEVTQISIKPKESITSSDGWITLSKKGVLKIKKGYAWDGASGPAIDTKSFIRGSLIHDALYQLLRQGVLLPNQRDVADKELYKLCIEDKMLRVRAWWVYKALQMCGNSSADPNRKRKVYTAP